jgi:hypothetical protein
MKQANDTTVVQGANSDSDVEILLEELPPTRAQPGTTFGHRGWVIGDEPEEAEGVEEDETKEEDEEANTRSGRKLAGAKKAQSVDKERVSGARAKKGKQKDEFALSSSESEREVGGNGDQEDPGDAAGSRSSRAEARAARRSRVGRAAGGKAEGSEVVVPIIER